MTELREHWEGVSVGEQYTLERWLGGDDSTAFFQTLLGPKRLAAIVKLVPEAVAEPGQLDLWHRARQLHHPNLVELLDCGQAEHGGEIAFYAVFEFPDDTLAAALSNSALDQAESREVLDSIISALRYLHAEGLVVGALGPDTIVAIGDRIKLFTDNIREAHSAADYGTDVRLLGEFWRQTVMMASPKSAEIAAHAADPDPAARWTLDEVGAALEASIPTTTLPSPSADRPVVNHTDELAVPPRGLTAEQGTSSRVPKWPFAAAAGVLLLILGFNRTRPAEVTAQRVSSVSLPAAAPPPAPRKMPVPGFPLSAKPKFAAAESMAVWRVIAFTYRTRDAAAKKSRQINEHHPGLDATVFSPDGAKGYHLVSLGGRMTHDEAVRLRLSARGKGLPRDLFVQNYTR